LKTPNSYTLMISSYASAFRNNLTQNRRLIFEKNAVIDYVEVVNADTLENVDEIKGRVLVALAVKFGSTRLIDNVIVEV